MSPRFFRPGDPGEACSTFSAGNFQYRTYPVRTTGNTLTASFNNGACGTDIYVTFHESGFDPANICSGYVWAYGSSVDFSAQTFSVTPNTNMLMVVSAVNSNVACGPYSWEISGVANSNIWLRKLKVTNSTKAGADAWQASYLTNANRLYPQHFDPASESFSAELAGNVITVPAGSFKQSASGVLSFKSDKNASPAYTVKVVPSKQTVDVKVSKINDLGVDLADATLSHAVTLGQQAFGFGTKLSSQGKHIALTAYPQDSVAAASVSLKNIKDAGKGAFSAAMFFESPSLLSSFVFDGCKTKCNQPAITLRLKEGVQTLLEKDLSGLVYATKTLDKKTGAPIYTLKKLGKDSAADNVLGAFSYTNKTGALKMALSKLALQQDIAALDSPLTVELVIDGLVLKTTVTLFATDASRNNYNSTFRKKPLVI